MRAIILAVLVLTALVTLSGNASALPCYMGGGGDVTCTADNYTLGYHCYTSTYGPVATCSEHVPITGDGCDVNVFGLSGSCGVQGRTCNVAWTVPPASCSPIP